MNFTWRCLIAPIVLLSLFLPISIAAADVPLTREQLFQLATLAARDEQFERAVELFQKVIELDPRFAPAYNGLGLVHQTLSQGDLTEAIRYFRMATDLAPDYFESWNNLGRAYYARGRFVDAEKAFIASLELKPDQPDIQLALAWDYLLGQSRPEEALKYFNLALPSRAGQANPMIHYGMGLAYMLQGDRFKVLDAVTQLRRRQKEEEALRLETMVRENVNLTSRPGTPLVTGPAGQASVFDAQLKELEAHGFNAGSKDGIKVRLKGPLL